MLTTELRRDIIVNVADTYQAVDKINSCFLLESYF